MPPTFRLQNTTRDLQPTHTLRTARGLKGLAVSRVPLPEPALGPDLRVPDHSLRLEQHEAAERAQDRAFGMEVMETEGVLDTVAQTQDEVTLGFTGLKPARTIYFEKLHRASSQVQLKLDADGSPSRLAFSDTDGVPNLQVFLKTPLSKKGTHCTLSITNDGDDYLSNTHSDNHFRLPIEVDWEHSDPRLLNRNLAPEGTETLELSRQGEDGAVWYLSAGPNRYRLENSRLALAEGAIPSSLS